MLKHHHSINGMWLTWLLAAPFVAAASESLPVIDVGATASGNHAEAAVVLPEDRDYLPPDVSDYLALTPGANSNKNGPLTGISQYRGLFGSRLNTQLDGLNIAPAGPNWMDPPLSHLAASRLQSLRVSRGISPVSEGAESLGGTIQARSRTLPWSAGDAWQAHGHLLGGYDSNNKAWTLGGELGMSSAHQRLQLQGSSEQGQDMQAGNSRYIVPTAYQRHSLGADWAYRSAMGTATLGYTRENVANSGTPALPMDISSVRGNTFNFSFVHAPATDGLRWQMNLRYSNTDHKMDNYSQRSAPVMLGMMGMPMRRYALTHAKSTAATFKGELPLADSRLSFGAEAWLARHQADVFDPGSSAFLLRNYNAIRRDRLGGFVQWQTDTGDGLAVQAGLRYSRVNMYAGTVSAQGLSGMMATAANSLATAFNNSSRHRSDNLVDATLKLTQTVNDALSFTLGLARKQRAPSYQERYLWSPLESTAGLADQRTYIGDVALKPETAWHVDVGMNWESAGVRFTPHVFYKRIDNYIQGTPIANGTALNLRAMQGNMLRGGNFCGLHPQDPFCVPLQFSNVSAALYGADAGLAVDVGESALLEGTISWVQGKRRDIGDYLYRIEPLNGRVAATWFAGDDWSLTTEGVFYARQSKVSTTNAEQASAGYSLFHIHGRYELKRDISLMAGVNNVLNRFYRPHLGGYNRVTANAAGQASAVATGTRMAGEGRSAFLQVRASF